MSADRLEHYDVAIVGAGLAGLTLARQLLLTGGDRRIVMLEKRATIPPEGQKVGEATVQVSGYYLSKVLDLEEHLLREHFLKYNLRFYWKSAKDPASFENYSQSYIRPFSNIATYQLDRNKLEGELLRLNLEDARFTFRPGVSDIAAAVDETPHRVAWSSGGAKTAVTCDWVVDTSGRGKLLARPRGLHLAGSIRHGTSFMWVDGLLNVEKLTGLDRMAALRHPQRSTIGHAPLWLATNHFCGEGFWFWTIPLQGKTSLGLVFDSALIPYDRVSSAKKLTEWVCAEFPLFARDLPGRRILHHGGYKDFAFDCTQTISADRWALSGEAGRFSDPLYSPGGDLISTYNTLIVDAITTEDASELSRKAALYEQMMRAFYEGYVPGFALSYNTLGDQEAFSLKYTWELTIYFAFYVFPFINGLFTDLRFATAFLRRFTELGRANRAIQAFLSDFYRWKQAAGVVSGDPVFFDFMELGPLRDAERTFYSVGVDVDEAVRVIDRQFASVQQLGRFIATHVASRVVGDRDALWNRAFVEDVDLAMLTFDPEEMRARHQRTAASRERYAWPFDPAVMARFRTASAGVV
jgi:flavin-dependent dehydrogenase